MAAFEVITEGQGGYCWQPAEVDVI